MKPQYPMGKVEAYYHFRFSLAIGIFVGSLLSSWREGLMFGGFVIAAALIIRLYQEKHI